MMNSPKHSKRHLTAHYSNILLYDKSAGENLKNLELATCNPVSNENEERSQEEPINPASEQDLEKNLIVSDSMHCNCCQTDFADRDEQLQHYKCDWHRYNLHLRLRGQPNVSEEEFEKIAGDVSSISGSDDESDSEMHSPTLFVQSTEDSKHSETQVASIRNERKFHKIFFKNEKGDLISLYRCLLHHKKKPLMNSSEICANASQLTDRLKWTILMVSSGHFAGAVFNGKDVIEHKTFHRYTVRAKRGTAQSSKDNQGNAPKSGGASLRRYNEAALVQDVQELMVNWLNHLKSCHLIFVHIPVANRAMFYSGKNPILKRDDDRVRIIPFPTKRPTFNEVKRVHQILASIECYGKEVDVQDFIPLSPRRIYNRDSGQLEVLQESQDIQPVLKPAMKDIKEDKTENDKQFDVIDSPIQVCSSESESPKEEEGEVEDAGLIELMESISIAGDLKEFDSSVRKKRKKKRVKTTQANSEVPCKDQLINAEERHFRNEIFTFCKVANIEGLQKVFDEINHTQSSSLCESKGLCQLSPVCELEKNSMNPESCKPEYEEKSDSLIDCKEKRDGQSSRVGMARILNLPLHENGDTFLHLTSSEGYSDIVMILMEYGADPAIKNRAGKLPYNLGNTEVRNVFRRFMAQFPDKYDYNKAQVPSPLTEEMEEQKRQKLAKRRADKKKAMQERNKAKKAAERVIQQEQEEKTRFLSLSDREKRALAAEKRILLQHEVQGSAKPVLSRCWQCGIDITGKVPFEYADYKFCTTKCLREHRLNAKS